MQSPPKVLLFDLGGVIVHWAGIGKLVELSPKLHDIDEARKYWLASSPVRKFERGQCHWDEFASTLIRELELPMESDAFLPIYSSWIDAPYPGVLELLDSQKSKFVLACLSNTNEVHWKKMRDEYGVGDYFSHCYISHEIGHMKPDREIYDYVLSDLGCPAEEIMFFDDSPECVHGAQVLGFQAHLVLGVDTIREVLAGI